MSQRRGMKRDFEWYRSACRIPWLGHCSGTTAHTHVCFATCATSMSFCHTICVSCVGAPVCVYSVQATVCVWIDVAQLVGSAHRACSPACDVCGTCACQRLKLLGTHRHGEQPVTAINISSAQAGGKERNSLPEGKQSPT